MYEPSPEQLTEQLARERRMTLTLDNIVRATTGIVGSYGPAILLAWLTAISGGAFGGAVWFEATHRDPVETWLNTYALSCSIGAAMFFFGVASAFWVLSIYNYSASNKQILLANERRRKEIDAELAALLKRGLEKQ